ncbi:MAG TPA: DUF5916 domain-containing protein [Segetibacter sp.]|jgi:hypothetical protein
MRFILLQLILCTCIVTVSAQTAKREIKAVKTTLSIKIDGELNDEAWKTAAVANNFTEQRPVFGRIPEDRIKSEAFILYDNNAVYVAGFCREPSRDSISTELIGRDRVGVNDFAGVMFDTYLDEINGVGFYVTALGEQFDTKYSLNNEDGSWSTVYQTATRITDSGWSYEMMIPYSALRFSKEKVQSWGINFVRRRTKTGQQFVWSPLNPNKFGTMNQAGIWKDIEDIKAPLRLSFSPYLSTYLNGIPNSAGKKDWNTTVNGGMDVKYGISKAFTLDMTLIPDFGQVQSDNQILNLSPFEVRFNENRSFFTEGTELFNKGNLFYSRRIGGVPLNFSKPYSNLSANEKVLLNPSETKLINATKISGRTAGGLGIGFFNAVTKPQYATIENDKHELREVETNPLTNYNILVLDQTMKNNSSVSLVNTNVLRSGSDYDANVTAALFDIYDRNIAWNVWGKVANSNLFSHPSSPKTISGYNYEINFGRFKGPLNFELHQHAADNKYQQNDMGFFNNNNYINTGGGAWYRINKPKDFYNNIGFQFNWTYSQRFIPRDYQFLSLNFNANSQLKNLWGVGVNLNFNPQQQDFYEPRVAGRMFKGPGWSRVGFRINTNSAKKYSASIQFNERISPKYKGNTADIFLSNQYRFNEKFTAGLNTYAEFAKNNVGFAFVNSPADVIFGLRDRHTVENILNLKYNFNIKMGLTFRARHYWSKVDYSQFYNLKQDGYLQKITGVTRDPNQNLNLFNIDMVYTWQFGPGSFINIGWKNTGQQFDQNVLDRYYQNLERTLTEPQQNNFSIKVIYFLDYLSLKKN